MLCVDTKWTITAVLLLLWTAKRGYRDLAEVSEVFLSWTQGTNDAFAANLQVACEPNRIQ